jgi:hypothetical protein
MRVDCFGRFGSAQSTLVRSALVNLEAASAALNLETLATLQRGILVADAQSALDAYAAQEQLVALLSSAVGEARIRAAIQGTSDAETYAFLTRAGTDGLQLSDRVWHRPRLPRQHQPRHRVGGRQRPIRPREPRELSSPTPAAA